MMNRLCAMVVLLMLAVSTAFAGIPTSGGLTASELDSPVSSVTVRSVDVQCVLVQDQLENSFLLLANGPDLRYVDWDKVKASGKDNGNGDKEGDEEDEEEEENGDKEKNGEEEEEEGGPDRVWDAPKLG